MSHDRLAQADEARANEEPGSYEPRANEEPGSYEPPTLTVVGSIEEVTRGAGTAGTSNLT